MEAWDEGEDDDYDFDGDLDYDNDYDEDEEVRVANLQLKDEDGRTAIDMAIEWGHRDLERTLLAANLYRYHREYEL